MTDFTATNGVISYVGTTDSDSFQFSTQDGTRLFDIGTTVDGRGEIDLVDFAFGPGNTPSDIIIDLETGYSVDGVTYVTFQNVEWVSVSDLIGIQAITINGSDADNVLAGENG